MCVPWNSRAPHTPHLSLCLRHTKVLWYIVTLISLRIQLEVSIALKLWELYNLVDAYDISLTLHKIFFLILAFKMVILRKWFRRERFLVSFLRTTLHYTILITSTHTLPQWTRFNVTVFSLWTIHIQFQRHVSQSSLCGWFTLIRNHRCPINNTELAWSLRRQTGFLCSLTWDRFQRFCMFFAVMRHATAVHILAGLLIWQL